MDIIDIKKEALKLHKAHKGKIEVISKVNVESSNDLSCVYTPGVAEPCKFIEQNPDAVYDYTTKGNLVAIISDGTAVLGLGDIGPMAAMPVMEGKAILFKKFANIDAFPICLGTKNVEEIISTVKSLEPTFGGINLEDISAPRCFEIEKRLKEEMTIPVFHDDQHGTAIVVLAALLNALKLVNKKIGSIKTVIVGAGSAGIAITKLLMNAGLKNAILVDKMGALCLGEDWMNPSQADIAKITNPEKIRGNLKSVIKNADVFIGVSGPGVLTKEMVAFMNYNGIVFAMANPVPEIFPDEAKKAGIRIIGTGRSDYPNQINNVLAFPGIFRGALDVHASDINEEMKVAAAHAIANIISKEELTDNYIIPKVFDINVVKKVAEAVANIAIKSGVAKI